MINLKNVVLIRGSLCLLDDVSLTLHAGQTVGLVGLNGSGKTSLFLMLLQQIEPNSGVVEYNDKLTFAYVSQETEPFPYSALDFVLQGDQRYHQLQQQIADAELHGHFEHLAEYHAQLADIDGYTAPSRAAEILFHLGFNDEQQTDPVASFSGGWRVRLNLARALFTPADLLLLDEPTNHLDLNTIVWLEKWLCEYRGSLMVISHDRIFLDHVIDHVWHINHKKIDRYTGNYSQFEAVYAEKLALQKKMFEKQQAKIKHSMRFVNRFRAKASKAKQAQSRLKMIAKMETVASVQAESPIEFDFFEPDHTANPVATIRDCQCGYGDAVILQDVDCQIHRGDRIGLLGENGAGKSTFIKTLMGELPPLAGECETAKNLKIGYFAQHQLEFLAADLSPLAHLREVADGASESSLRAYLGQFGFSDDRVFEPLGHFSGGEKSRLALSLIIYQKPALLLLDEPTNHLDLETRMALMLALQNYTGSLLLVSHDRYLMNSITDQLWLIKDNTITEYQGGLDDYETMIRKKECSSLKREKSSTRVSTHQENKNIKRIAQLERKITKLQKDIANAEAQMCDNRLFEEDQQDRYHTLQARKQSLKEEVAILEEEWLSLEGRV